MNYKYILDKLQKGMLYGLSQVIKHFTILKHFKKIDLYLEKKYYMKQEMEKAYIL